MIFLKRFGWWRNMKCVASPPSSRIKFGSQLALATHFSGEINLVRTRWTRRTYAPPELLFAFSFPRENRDACLCQRRGDFILSRKDVASAPTNLSSKFNQRFNENCSLGSHVSAPHFERLETAEKTSERSRHVRPFPILAPFSGLSPAALFLSDISAGISCSAISISLRPI